MSRKRWIARVAEEAKKTGNDAYRALPFTRQVRLEKRLAVVRPIQKVARA
ncbi:MAG: hypothetical protein AAF714_08730 [Pseudomonadota bacterium]